MRKAQVFPDPVSATPMMSRFCNPMGMACLWMGVGSYNKTQPLVCNSLTGRNNKLLLLLHLCNRQQFYLVSDFVQDVFHFLVQRRFFPAPEGTWNFASLACYVEILQCKHTEICWAISGNFSHKLALETKAAQSQGAITLPQNRTCMSGALDTGHWPYHARPKTDKFIPP